MFFDRGHWLTFLFAANIYTVHHLIEDHNKKFCSSLPIFYKIQELDCKARKRNIMFTESPKECIHMPDIYISSTNKVILGGKVVGKPSFSKTANGRETCRLCLQTDKHMMVKGKSQVFSTIHDVLVTNQYSVPAFKQNLREGDFIQVIGELGSSNGKAVVTVTDFGHEAIFLYVPSDGGGQNSTPAKVAKGGAFDMSDLPGKSNNGGGDDDYFRQNAAFERAPPSKIPEGFDESDDIPF
jgi:single-stranded DNA-binding protein